VTDRVLEVGGLRLAVRERGEGHPLLLVNGLGGNVDMRGPAQERLSSRARTIAFDAPGTGRSLRRSPGGQPYKALSGWFRRVALARHGSQA
jgi:pimeloyl-ACP methyl ester carboxylesterase